MPHHQGFSITNGCAGCIVTREKFIYRKIVGFVYHICEFLQSGTAVSFALTALFANQVVCLISSDALAPVAGFEININTVSPPIVQQFVWIR